MAYRFLFAIFPLLLFLVSSLGFAGQALGLHNVYENLMRHVTPFLPSQVSSILVQYGNHLFVSRSSASVTIGFAGTVWGAAGGVGTLVKGLNRAYDVEQARPFVRRQLLALNTMLILPTVGIAFFAVTVFGRNLVLRIGSWLGLRPGFAEMITTVRWPVLVLLLFVGFSLIYHVLPHIEHRYVHSLPGSAVATIGWIGLTQAFGLYLANFGKYDATYGSFGTAIAFLLWLYLVGVVILLGAEINALLEPRGRQRW